MYQKVDKFAGTTLYSTKLREGKLEGGSFISMRHAYFQFEAVSPVSPLITDPYTLLVRTHTPDWVFFSSGASLQLKIDGAQPIALQRMGQSSREVVDSNLLLEIGLYQLPSDTLEALAKAKSVEFRIVGEKQDITGSWKPELIADAQGFLTKMPTLLLSKTDPNISAPVPPAPTPIVCESAPDNGLRLGINYVLLPPSTLEKMHLTGGVGVIQVVDGSAASGAGLKVGDVLLSAGAKTIHSLCDVKEALSTLHKGEALTLHLWRAGKELDSTAQF